MGSGDKDEVAKIRILVEGDAGTQALLSRKKAKGKRGHGKLEMLGGHLDGSEAPHDALTRELFEEEATGALGKLADRQDLPFACAVVDDAKHYLFELTITSEVAAGLRADPAESLGLELVPAADLGARLLDDELTYRTRLILEAFPLEPGRE